MSRRPARLAVLASGSGSNFQAILDAVATGGLNADVVHLVADRADAFALERASRASVPATLLLREPGEARRAYDTRLAAVVGAAEPDLVVLAGWMRLLSTAFLASFPDQVINLHPALPGQFPGTNAISRALEAAHRVGLATTGVMVHFVPDEGVDDGPVIATRNVAILPDDTLDTLSARVHAAEHELLVSALRALIAAI